MQGSGDIEIIEEYTRRDQLIPFKKFERCELEEGTTSLFGEQQVNAHDNLFAELKHLTTLNALHDT